MNLTTANSANRSREIGIKKVFGSSRPKLFGQFIGETIILSFVSIIIAIALVEFFLNDFNAFTSKEISRDFIFKTQPIIFLISDNVDRWCNCRILSSNIPVLLKPINVLGGTVKIGSKGGWPRKLLVVFQFSISISLIIGTLIVYSQLNFIRKADLGFQKDQIILLSTNRQISQNYLTLKNELLSHSEIKICNRNGRHYRFQSQYKKCGYRRIESRSKLLVPNVYGAHDFLETFDIEVLKDEDFQRKSPPIPLTRS